KGGVVDGGAAAGGAAQCAAVRMAVDEGGGSELVERAREARRAEERVDLQRLAFDGGAARRVVEQGDARARAELEERVLELQLFGDACVDELLHHGFAESLQLGLVEPACESLDPGDPQLVAQ